MSATDRDELVEADIPLMLNQLRWLLKSIAAGSDHRDQLGPWIERVEQAAARIQADAATIAGMQEALVQAREAMSDGDPYKDVARQMVDAALKGGDHG